MTTPAPSRPDPLRSAEIRGAVEKVSDLFAFDVLVRYGVSTNASDRANRRACVRSRELTAASGADAADYQPDGQHGAGR